MRTTILNLDYSILSVVSWEHAMVLLFKGVIQPIEWWDTKIRSASAEWDVPKIATVKKFVRHHRKWHPTKKNIFIRDGHTCVYCGNENPSDMTIDHVMPKSRGGRDTWENLVCACYRCNHKKADRTPEEAEMILSIKPGNPQAYSW